MFYFKGKIIHAAANYPGSWPDSRVAYAPGLMFPKLGDRMTRSARASFGGQTVSDDGHAIKVVRGRKTNETEGITSNVHISAIDLIVQRVTSYERQTAEWAICIVKAALGILHLALSPSSRKRKRLLSTAVHLRKEHTWRVGLNQFQTTYANNGPDVQPWVRQLLVEQDQGSLSERHQCKRSTKFKIISFRSCMHFAGPAAYMSSAPCPGADGKLRHHLLHVHQWRR